MMTTHACRILCPGPLLAAALALAAGAAGCGDDDDVPAVDGAPPDAARPPDGALPTQLTVSSVLPAQGPLAGGTQVVVSGTAFGSGATVTFGARAGLNPIFLSSFQLRVDTPPADAAGKVSVTVTNPGGASATLPNAFEYRAPDPDAIDWCGLHFPGSLSVAPGVESALVFGQVWEQSCTEGEGRCARVTAELGVGSPDDDPSAAPGSFTWVSAAHNTAFVGDNDEYMHTLTMPSAGTYAYAYRASVDGGAAWTYCDLDGSGNGFQRAQMGSLVVAEDTRSVGWCALQHPHELAAAPGATTELVYGQLLVAGCTEAAARCADVTAELGVGPAGADPVSTPAAFDWQPADYNGDHTGDDNDEYMRTIVAGAAGGYAYLYRFSVDGGATWTYCDRDGGNGFQPAEMGALTVGSPAVNWCRLQYPEETATAPATATELIFGQAWVDGCTDLGARCPGVRAQVGWGATAADPSTDPASFTWLEADYNPAHVDDNDDEYMTTITPPSAGTFAYAVRFTRDDGATWTICDWDGSGNGFQTDQMGTLTVAAGSTVPIDWCNVQHPHAVEVIPDSSTGTIYGQVLSAGCTEGAAQCVEIRGELGWGPQGVDPSAAPGDYAWIPATYNPAHTGDDNDEFTAEIKPSAAGTFRYVYRFSGDFGASWTYCDTSGSPPFAAGDAGTLTVTAP